MTVATDVAATTRLIDRVEELEQVAATLGGDDRGRILLRIVDDELDDAGPARAAVAARLLRLNEKTVRAWHRAGVLTATADDPRLLLDMRRLHEVMHLVGDLREAGHTTGLLGEVYRRLADEAWAASPELAESLDQMRAGRGIPA